VAEATDEACSHARRLLAALTPPNDVYEESCAHLLRASEQLAAHLGWELQGDAPPEPISRIYEHLLVLELDLAAAIWRTGSAQAYVFLQTLVGAIAVDHASAIEPRMGEGDATRLMERLRELTSDAAQDILQRLLAEDTDRGDLLRELSIGRYRRIGVLSQLPAANQRMKCIAD